MRALLAYPDRGRQERGSPPSLSPLRSGGCGARRQVKLDPFKWGLLWAAFSLALDQACKALLLYGLGWIDTLDQLPGSMRPIEVLPFFDIVMVWNRGISYGLLQATSDFHRWILTFFAVGVISLLVWWLRSVQDRKLALALGLIIGGAIGNNVIDRVLYGAVADFFYLH